MSWYYAEQGQQRGPISEPELGQLLASGQIQASTLVWREGMATWQPLLQAAPHLMAMGQPGPVAHATQGAAATPRSSLAWQGVVAPGAQAQEYPFEFHGKAGEYFRIWLVNTALTLVTLGIYAAWAKVRTRQYFYRNTLLDGTPFDFTGNPKAILKGNLIMASFGLLYLLVASINPGVGFAMVLAFFVVSPWLIYKAFRFRAHHTLYRNLRFRFHGALDQSYFVYCALAILIPFTLGILMPYQQFAAKNYFYSNLAYGTTRSQFWAGPGAFYRIYLIAVGLGLIVLFGIMMVLTAMSMAGWFLAEEGTKLGTSPGAILFLGGLYLVLLIAFRQYFVVRFTNLCLNHTTFGGRVRFVSRLELRQVVGLHLTNLVAIILTCGLAIPWAKIRILKYRASRTSVVAVGGLNQFLADTTRDESAVGDAAADVFDMDLGL